MSDVIKPANFKKKISPVYAAKIIMNEEAALRKSLSDVYLRLINFSRLKDDGQWKEYERRWMELVEMSSSLSLPELRLFVQKSFQLEDWAKCRRYCESIIERPEATPEEKAFALYRLSEICARERDPRWKAHIERWVESQKIRQDRSFQDTYLLAIKLHQLGALDESEQYFLQIKDSDEGTPDQKAGIYFHLGGFAKSRSAPNWQEFIRRGIEDLIRKSPDSFLDFYRLGVKCFEIGDLPAAQMWLEKTLKYAAPSPQLQAEVYFILGDMCKRSGDEDMCHRYFRQGVESLDQKTVKDYQDLYQLGEKSYQAGDVLNSKRYFEEFVQHKDAPSDLVANARAVLESIDRTQSNPENESSEGAPRQQGEAPDQTRLMTIAKKRILYIAHGHSDYSPGGGELAAYFLYEEMKKSGEYEPFLLARIADNAGLLQHLGCWFLRHPQDDHTHLMVSSGQAYDYFYQTKIIGKLNETAIYQAFREFLLTVKPDIIHFQHYIHLGIDWVGMARSVLPEARILVTLHEYTAICAYHGAMIKSQGHRLCYGADLISCHECFPKRPPWQFFLRNRLFKSNFAAVDHFISPSHFLKQRHVEWGMAPETISVIENGRPIWPKTESARSRPGRPFTVAFFGQIVFHKGLEVFLKAAVQYLTQKRQSEQGKRLPDVTFIVSGIKHGLPTELGKQCDELMKASNEVLHVHGAYDMHSMPKLLERVDCVVIPSIWWENSPLVVQEAFMAGVPIICSNVGGLAEKVIDRVNGLHFVLGDHFDLLARIIELAESPELYAKLVQGIPAVYSSEEMSGLIHQLYRELLNRPSRSGGKEIQCA